MQCEAGTVNRRRMFPFPTQNADWQMKPCNVLEQRIANLLESRPEVLEAYLFGSHAQGRAQPHSDIDVAVYTDESITEEGAFGYRAQLTTEIMAGLNCNDIDLLILNQARPVLCYHVLRDGISVLNGLVGRRQGRGSFSVDRRRFRAIKRTR